MPQHSLADHHVVLQSAPVVKHILLNKFGRNPPFPKDLPPCGDQVSCEINTCVSTARRQPGHQ